MRKKSLVAVLLIAAVGFGFFGQNKKDTVATVENEAISLTELQERIDSFPAGVQKDLEQREAKVKVLNQMIDEILLTIEAKRLGYNKVDEFKKLLKAAERQILISLLIRDEVNKKIEVSDKELKKKFDDTLKPKKIEKRQLRHILARTQADAKALLKKVKSGSNFAELAQKYSVDTQSAKNGGNIGWFTRGGGLVPEFENVAFSLNKKGQISPIVKTQFGFHIIQLMDANQIGLEDVKPQLTQQVSQEKTQQELQQYLTILKEKYKIARDVSKIR